MATLRRQCFQGASCEKTGCRFRHPTGWVRPDKEDERVRNTCKFSLNNCSYGSSCYFEFHQPAQEYKEESGGSLTNAPRDRDTCKFPLDKCAYGESCYFEFHPSEAEFEESRASRQRSDSSAKPWIRKDLGAVYCRNGPKCNREQCSFNHDPHHMRPCLNGLDCRHKELTGRDCIFQHPLEIEPLASNGTGEAGFSVSSDTTFQCDHGNKCELSKCSKEHRGRGVECQRERKWRQCDRGVCEFHHKF